MPRVVAVAGVRVTAAAIPVIPAQTVDSFKAAIERVERYAYIGGTEYGQRVVSVTRHSGGISLVLGSWDKDTQTRDGRWSGSLYFFVAYQQPRTRAYATSAGAAKVCAAWIARETPA